MARVRTTDAPPRINAQVTPSLLKQVNMYAAEQGIWQWQAVIELLTEGLRAKKAKKGLGK